jgi:hypothetical protein
MQKPPAAAARTTLTSEHPSKQLLLPMTLTAPTSLQQFFNGWLQGYNAYNSPITLGTYFNLAVCF